VAHGQGATSNKTGGYGALARGSRGHGTDPAVKKAITRERDPRIQSAMDEVREHQEKLNALIEEQRKNPAVGEAAGAVYAAKQKKAHEELLIAQAKQDAIEAGAASEEVPDEPASEPTPIKPKFSTRKLQKESTDKFQFAGTTAHMMLKAGYHIAYVIEYTGIGYLELADFPLDEDGYGWPDRDKEDEEEEDERTA
jgi:hypothetical protein